MQLLIGMFRSCAVRLTGEESLYFHRSRFYTYERVQEIVAFIQAKVPTKPQFAIICGSGLGGLAELVNEKIVIPYADIPHFPQSTGKHSVQVSSGSQRALLTR
jgi:orotate phosphoribosyltransferase